MTAATDMVERVKIAISAALGNAVILDEPGAFIVDGEVDLTAVARAAIEAMREPTEGMLKASPVVGTGLDEHGNWAINTKPAQAVWPAMIDAALGSRP